MTTTHTTTIVNRADTARAQCDCAEAFDWTSHEEAEFDAARHLADNDATPVTRRLFAGFTQHRPCGTDAARRRHQRNGETCGDCGVGV